MHSGWLKVLLRACATATLPPLLLLLLLGACAPRQILLLLLLARAAAGAVARNAVTTAAEPKPELNESAPQLQVLTYQIPARQSLTGILCS